MRIILFFIACAALLSCQKPTIDECETLCWRYFELSFWDKFEKQTASLSSEEKTKARAQKAAEWEKARAEKKNQGRDNCMMSCHSGGNKKQVTCMASAQDFAEAEACMKME